MNINTTVAHSIAPSCTGGFKEELKIKKLPLAYYADFISDFSKELKPCKIRSLLPLERTPGLISLLVGRPNPSTFPFNSLTFTTKLPLNPQQEVKLTLDEDDLAQGLQYGDTGGFKPLLDWFVGLQEVNHGRKRDEGWRISMGSGSQDLIFKALCVMINRGDSVLVECPVYAGVIPMFHSLHCNIVEVESDTDGIRSSSLRSILEQWPSEKPKPKVLYTVPYGCNPTGVTATLQRRKEVLKLSREHNFIILEDDPYFYLYYGKAPRYPSYFALERQEHEVGRVLRFDSLSKILSAGMRIGFASGPEPLLDAIDLCTSMFNLQTSSLTQAIAIKLLNAWGYEGFRIHAEQVSVLYRGKRDIFEAAMKRNLSGLAEWTSPEAGMFFWFKLLNPNSTQDGDSEAVIKTKAFEKGVLALPGTAFSPNGIKTAYVRASFSVLEEEDVDKAIQRLRDAILDSQILGADV